MTLVVDQKSSKTKGHIFVISGPSGAGKGTMVNAALKAFPHMALSVSATTRSPRPGEVEGVDYHFKTNEEFDELLSNDGLLEWAEVHGQRYGTLTDEVNKALNEGRDLVLEIDPQGYNQVRSRMSEVCSIFIVPPSLDELKRRLELRGSESKESIERRLCTALVEMKMQDSYDVVIINDELEKATNELIAVISQRVCRENGFPPQNQTH